MNLFEILLDEISLFDIYRVNEYTYCRIENNVSVVAMDSHPKRTNGFLTGCLQSVLNNNVYARPFIEELPR